MYSLNEMYQIKGCHLTKFSNVLKETLLFPWGLFLAHKSNVNYVHVWMVMVGRGAFFQGEEIESQRLSSLHPLWDLCESETYSSVQPNSCSKSNNQHLHAKLLEQIMEIELSNGVFIFVGGFLFESCELQRD